MKLKVKISGPKVHDVGYRPCLTEIAMRLALRGFESTMMMKKGER
ncbi:Uncharacterised protein [uncultured archaeon]|nr:Uncharacterised protein [uncultured archaeon]